jgi:7-cyano-7-deazaguanine synthase
VSSAVVILSGGLDSSTNLVLALENLDVKLALTFDYGQRAAPREVSAAAQLCDFYKVKHKVIAVPWIGAFGKSALTDTAIQVPTNEVKIDDLTVSNQTAAKVWVPNRNGIFLNIAAGFAESIDCEYIIPGFNLEEATTFPDNSKSFIEALVNSFSYSTANQVKIKCYTIDMVKTDIVKVALQKKLPLEMIWPCYFDGQKWCGVCESCQRSKRAIQANGVDTAAYFMS